VLTLIGMGTMGSLAKNMGRDGTASGEAAADFGVFNTWKVTKDALRDLPEIPPAGLDHLHDLPFGVDATDKAVYPGLLCGVGTTDKAT